MTAQSDDPSNDDVLALLMSQHEQIRALLDHVSGSRGEQRAHAFNHLRRVLAVHEAAEEMVLHPRVRRVLEEGDVIVTARLHEERAAKAALERLEAMELDSAEFNGAFGDFRHDVLAHAAAEEHEEFEYLRDELDDAQRRRLRRAVAVAQALAPTRPHPNIELAGEYVLAGPFAAMFDRARDLLSS